MVRGPRWEDSSLTLTQWEGASARGHSLTREEGAGPLQRWGRVEVTAGWRGGAGRGPRAGVAQSSSLPGPRGRAAGGPLFACGGRGRGHYRPA